MEHDGTLMLMELRGRGGFVREGDMLSQFALEFQGKLLHIYGRGRCCINETRAAHMEARQEEYHYYLEEAEAARLLAALEEDFGSDELPERLLLREFEFTSPRNPLCDYLDAHQITYIYTVDRDCESD